MTHFKLTRRMVALIIIVAVILSALIQADYSHAADRHGASSALSRLTLDGLATELVGYPVTVDCYPDNPDNIDAGWVDLYDLTVIHMEGWRCGAIRNALNLDNPRTMHWALTYDGSGDIGYALMTLQHEAAHLTLAYTQGLDAAHDEGLTECTAYRNVWNTIKVLTTSPTLRRLVWFQTGYSHYGKSPTGPYRTVC